MRREEIYSYNICLSLKCEIAFLKTVNGVYVCVCECECKCISACVWNGLASLKSDLGWAPASFPCLLPFTHVSVEICQIPCLMVPRAVFRAVEPGQPFSMGLIAGSPFSCSSVKVWLNLLASGSHSLETIVKGFHHSTQYWPTQLGNAFCPWIKCTCGGMLFQIGH